MSVLTALISSKIAIGIGVAGVAVAGGAGAAAYANVLPPVAQQVAHQLVGAPAPAASSASAADETGTSGTAADEPVESEAPTLADEPTSATDAPTASAAPVGPDATGAAAHGLCTAFAHGGLAATSTAYASLTTAAGGVENVASYCAPFLRSPAMHAPNAAASPTATATGSRPLPPAAGSHTSTRVPTTAAPSKASAHESAAASARVPAGAGSSASSHEGR